MERLWQHCSRSVDRPLAAHLNGGTVFRESDRPYAESSEKFVMSNRIGRLEFLFWCCIPLIVGSIVFSIVALSLGAIDANTPAGDPKFRSLLAPVALIVSIVALRAAVSRLHDLGLVGWAVVLAFVPLVGIVLFLVLFILPGQKVSNAYGEPPIFLGRWRKSKQITLPFS